MSKAKESKFPISHIERVKGLVETLAYEVPEQETVFKHLTWKIYINNPRISSRSRHNPKIIIMTDFKDVQYLHVASKMYLKNI